MSTRTGIAKTTSTSPSATMLPRELRLATAIRLTHATKMARFLIWIGKSANLTPKALGGDMELVDSIHLGGDASGSGALRRLLRPRTMSRPPTVALMTRPTVETVPAASLKRLRPVIPITAQVVKYPSTRAVALGRGLREPKNRMVRRSKGGAIAPPMARKVSWESRLLMVVALAVVRAMRTRTRRFCAA